MTLVALVFLSFTTQASATFIVTNASRAIASDIATLEQRLEIARGVLAGFLGRPLPAVVEVIVSDGPGIPNARDGRIEVFYSEGRIRADAVEHELTHVTMGYTGRGAHLAGVEEGLASFAGESLNPAASFPHIGQSADAWATYFIQSGQALPMHGVLTGAYRFGELGTADDLRCWQSYIEAASFVRWMVETQGWPVFWQFYEETKEFGLTQVAAAKLEPTWRTHLLAKKIKPLPPKLALPQADPRFQAWTRMLIK
jgi:hypothetical protein